MRPVRSSQCESRVRLVMTSPGRMRTPNVSNWPPFSTLPPFLGVWPGTAPAGLKSPVGIGQEKGLKSSGATMPPQRVVLAYSSSQNSRGGVFGQ